MSSTRRFDFRLRTNKSIERAIVFDSLKTLQPYLGQSPIYVGLGSLWFVDFRMAHRQLGIETMISIEGDLQLVSRARFNRPYRSIEVVAGMTTDVVPGLLERDELNGRPWIVWLDYDSVLTEERVDELANLVRELPDGSAVLSTFNATPNFYGEYDRRVEALADMFGADIVGSGLQPEDVNKNHFGGVLARCVTQYLESVAIRARRPGGFVSAIRLRYTDSAPMVTIGGLLPGSAGESGARATVAAEDWIGFEEEGIAVEPLTMREADALCQLLPCSAPLKSSDVAKLGFELPEPQIRFFERHYVRYPSYAEIVT